MDFTEDYFERASLETGAREHFEVLSEVEDQNDELVFLWGGCTWFGQRTKRRTATRYNVQRLADCEIRLMFTVSQQEDALFDVNIFFIVETRSEREGIRYVRLLRKELVSTYRLTVAFLNVRQNVRVPAKAASAFRRYLLEEYRPCIPVSEYLSLVQFKSDAELKAAFDRIAGRAELPNKGAQDALRLLRGNQAAQ